MRMLFSSTPGLGSLHPLIALAREAKTQGHDVAIATSDGARSMIERLGFAFMPAGGNARSEMMKRHPEVPLPPVDDESLRQVRQLMFAGVFVEFMLPGLLDACRSWRPDVVVHGHIALAPLIAAEGLGIPHVTIEEAASGEPAQGEAMFHEPLAGWRAERGLPPDPELTSIRRYLWLVPFPASIRNANAPFGPTARRLQPLIFNETQQAAPPAWLDDLPAGPIVHASLGTVAQRPELLRILVDGLAGEPYTVVLATGTPALSESLGELPPNVRAAPFIPHSVLLPRCDALITHAGAGTLITGITHGLPMVMVPLFGDQPPNAEGAAAAGAGVVLDPSTLTPDRVREATREVLGNANYRERLGRLQKEIAELPPVSQAVTWLKYVAQHRTTPPANL